MLALILSGSLPITALFANGRSFFKRREVGRAISALALAGLFVVTMSCGPSCGKPRSAAAYSGCNGSEPADHRLLAKAR